MKAHKARKQMRVSKTRKKLKAHKACKKMCARKTCQKLKAHKVRRMRKCSYVRHVQSKGTNARWHDRHVDMWGIYDTKVRKTRKLAHSIKNLSPKILLVNLSSRRIDHEKFLENRVVFNISQHYKDLEISFLFSGSNSNTQSKKPKH